MKYLPKIDSPTDLRRLPENCLPQVAQELREHILEAISKKGGHLGSAMGAIELTVALHYVFKSPEDRLVWDVGHQCHAHKILTGRRDRFPTIKQEGGLSGFLKRSESEHDVFGAGHASTAISAALGIREAVRLSDGKGKVVAIVGDGGLTGGMAFEALNNAGALKRDLIVVLNDNGMSISPNVGALSNWFSRKLTGDPMTRLRRRVRTFLESLEGIGGTNVIHIIEHLMDATKHVMLTPGTLFEGLGFEYMGPIDGHDLPELIDALTAARNLDKPTLVHAVTQKGKGYPAAERDDEAFHGVGPFDLRSGRAEPSKPGPPSYTNVFGDTLSKLARTDPRIVAITAAMPQGTGLVSFSKEFPGRFYDVGIAEEHAVTFAAGLACEGYRPVCAIYSTFLQRAFDQIVHDVCLQNLPVVFAMDRAGLVGPDGPTHHGVLDMAMLRTIPNMTIMAPRDENQLQRMLLTAVSHSGPVALRYPRGSGTGVALDEDLETIPLGQAEVLLEDGKDLLLLAVGSTVAIALEAAATLKTKDVKCTVVDARFIKPLDEALFEKQLQEFTSVITLEEGCLSGGFGSAILEFCQDRALRPRIQRLGLPDKFIEHGSVKNLHQRYGLSVDSVLKAQQAMAEDRPVLSLA
jgi:1-deoxy-D-xylulose-5-phosphate synthase